MNPKPQTLTLPSPACSLAVFAALMALVAVHPEFLLAQNAQATSADAPQTPPTAQLTVADQSTEEIFAGIHKTLDETESLSCTLQQTITMSGQKFLAAGSFIHASGNRMRLEYRLFPVVAQQSTDKEKLAVGGEGTDISKLKETGALTQVSDGSVLWSYWINDKDKQLTRRNLQEINDAVSRMPSEKNLREMQSLGVGGLKALVSQLQLGMEFGAAQEQVIGSQKLYVLSGRWNAKTRQEVLGVGDDSTARLPDYIPDYVRVYIDSELMLPVRVQYLKKHPATNVNQVRPLVTLDLRGIKRNIEIADSTFEFQRPDDPDLVEVDLTAQIIQGIEQVVAPAKPTAAKEE